MNQYDSKLVLPDRLYGSGLTRKAENQITGRIFTAVCPFEINTKSLWNVIRDSELTVHGFGCAELRQRYVKEQMTIQSTEGIAKITN
jgi:hypothetical protein